MIHQTALTLKAAPKGFHLITEAILKAAGPLPEKGLLSVFIQHTSAALSVNENADPTVREDLDSAFDRVAPEDAHYLHTDEGPDDMPAHIKSVLTGSSITVPITDGKLNLGIWQGIYLAEFRNHARGRNVIISLFS